MELEESVIILGAGILILLLFSVGYLGGKIRIPGVILYIILGIVVGSFISDNEFITIAGKIGIVFLFFLLGLEFPISRLGDTAKKVWSGGLLDVFFNFICTTLLCVLFGLDWLPAFLIGGAAYATSSSITANLLDRTKRMANIEGEYMLGLLIFEDLVAPIIVAVLIGVTSGDKLVAEDFIILILKIVVLTAGAIIIGRYGFSKLSEFIERINDEDIFILLTSGIALAYAGLSLMLGLSEVLGAFLAGMMLAETKKMADIENVAIPVRDLFMPIFFLSFGMTIDITEGIPMIPLLSVLLLWSVLAKVAVGAIGGRWFGLPKRAAVRAGLSITARGEFSVVIATLITDASLKIFSGIYILGSAIIGIALFLAAPAIARKLYGKKNKQKPDIHMPGS